MGYVHAEIELINAFDLKSAKRGHLDTDEIKRMNIIALVDTGSTMLAINENIQEYLQAPFLRKEPLRLANDTIVFFDIVGPILVRFKNHEAVCNAIVLPGSSEPLLGAIPMEEMDVLIHPQRQELVANPNPHNKVQIRY